MLEKMPKTNSRMIYTQDQYNFNCEVYNGFVFICMCDAKFSAGVTFNFINDIKTRWDTFYRENQENSTREKNFSASFKSVLKKRMHFYNTDPSANKIKKLKNQIADVKEEMVNNIERTLLRGEKIEILVDKTENLAESSTEFRGKSKTLKTAMITKWVALVLVTITVLLVIGLVLFFYLCSGVKCIQQVNAKKNSTSTSY